MKKAAGHKNSGTCDGGGGCTLFRAAHARRVELDLPLCCVTHGQLLPLLTLGPGSGRIPLMAAQVARGPAHAAPCQRRGLCYRSRFCHRKPMCQTAALFVFTQR